jgi:hypothetical protein
VILDTKIRTCSFRDQRGGNFSTASFVDSYANLQRGESEFSNYRKFTVDT